MKPLPLLLGLALICCSSPRKETSIFGEPLFVNGRRVSDDEIKLALINGPCRPIVDLSKVGLIIEDEISRQSEDNAQAEIAALEQKKPFADSKARAKALAATRKRLSAELHEKYRVRDDEFDAEYTYNVDDFRKSFPVLDIGAEICRAFRSIDLYRDQLRQSMHFDRVFLPPNPDDWPATTIKALRSDPSGGELLIPNAKQSYEARREAAARDDGKLPREDSLMMTFEREIVRNAMFDRMTFKTQPDGIDPRLALWADSNSDGKPEVSITIDELWNKVQDTVMETDIDETKQWFIAVLAVHDRLAKDGALLSDTEAKRLLNKLTEDVQDGLTTLEQLATKSYLFPSIESFSEYYAMHEGYRRMIAPKLAPGRDGAPSPALREHLDRARLVMGLGMVDCEVLLVSAMDVGRFRWKKNGWAEARRKALALREEYDRDPTPQTWSRLMDANSEYWDPPPPEAHDGKQQKQSDIGYKKKGRFGPRYRNDLIGYVGESPYSEWVTGESITDHIFFDQAEGTVDGPFRGPLGWYLTRVIKRTPPLRPLDTADPKVRKLLEDDYVRRSFIQYTKEAVARAKIRGWAPL